MPVASTIYDTKPNVGLHGVLPYREVLTIDTYIHVDVTSDLLPAEARAECYCNCYCKQSVLFN